MDRSLDEILAERQTKSSGGSRGSRGGGGRRRERRDDFPRDGVRKSFRDEPRRLDDEWVHDRFDENEPRTSRAPRRQESPNHSKGPSSGTKIRVDNIHYELTQEDLTGLFEQIGPISRLELVYDRAGRSEGTAYVTYESYIDAKEAFKQYDGANANGQPIRLTIMPSGPGSRTRNPFDGAVKPPGTGRPLAERISLPKERDRSTSPGRDLSAEASRKGIDRYVPGGGAGPSRSRSPLPPGRRDGRRPGERRGGAGGRQQGGGGGARGGRDGRDGRPRKTQDELDAEMADYFGTSSRAPAPASANGHAGTAEAQGDDDDMIG